MMLHELSSECWCKPTIVTVDEKGKQVTYREHSAAYNSHSFLAGLRWIFSWLTFSWRKGA